MQAFFYEDLLVDEIDKGDENITAFFYEDLLVDEIDKGDDSLHINIKIVHIGTKHSVSASELCVCLYGQFLIEEKEEKLLCRGRLRKAAVLFLHGRTAFAVRSRIYIKSICLLAMFSF